MIRTMLPRSLMSVTGAAAAAASRSQYAPSRSYFEATNDDGSGLSFTSRRSAVIASQGMVASSQPLARCTPSEDKDNCNDQALSLFTYTTAITAVDATTTATLIYPPTDLGLPTASLGWRP